MISLRSLLDNVTANFQNSYGHHPSEPAPDNKVNYQYSLLDSLHGRPIYDDSGKMVGFVGFDPFPKPMSRIDQVLGQYVSRLHTNQKVPTARGNPNKGVRTPLYDPYAGESQPSDAEMQQEQARGALTRYYRDRLFDHVNSMPTQRTI